MSEVKFREFSVAPYSKGLTRWSVVSAPATAVDTDFDGIHPKIINLIEYSALAAKDAEIEPLKAENAELKRKYAWLIRHSWMCSAISKAKAAQLLGCSLVDFDEEIARAIEEIE